MGHMFKKVKKKKDNVGVNNIYTSLLKELLNFIFRE